MKNIIDRRDITKNTFVDIEIEDLEGDVKENGVSSSSHKSNQKTSNAQVFESTSARYSCNCKIPSKWAFGCIGAVIIICSSILPLIADIQLHDKQAQNVTSLNDTTWQRRIDSRLVAYCFESFLTPIALGYLLYIYYSFALKSDHIRRSVLNNGDLRGAIKQIKNLSLNVSRLQKTSKQRLLLVYAHRYASIYVSCCMLFGLAYLWYVRTWALSISNDFFFKFVGHFLAYGGLVCVMWMTNVIIDRMKTTVLHVGSSGHPKIEDINLPEEEKVLFPIVIERCQLYAFLYFRKVSLPGVLATILPGAASLALRYINRRLRLYELFSDKT